jgi:hypothetical protein
MPITRPSEESAVIPAMDRFRGDVGRRCRRLAIELESPNNLMNALPIMQAKWDAAWTIEEMRAFDCPAIKLGPLVATEERAKRCDNAVNWWHDEPNWSRSLASNTVAVPSNKSAVFMRTFLLYWLAPPVIVLLMLLILACSFR